MLRSTNENSLNYSTDSLSSTSTSAQNESNITIPQTTIAYLDNGSSLRLNAIVQQTPIVITTVVVTPTSPSNLLPPSQPPPELTTEKLSLTNKILSDSLVNITNFVANNSSKSAKQRGNSNTIAESTNSGGIRVTGQKIEMPQLNNLFDHSMYMKKNEHGYR